MANVLIAPGHGSPMNHIVNQLRPLLTSEQGQQISAEIQAAGFDLDHAIAESVSRPTPPNEWAQPVDYVLGWLSWQMTVCEGWHPTAVAGHSLGEFLSLAAAGVFSWIDGLHLVQQCGADMDKQARARPSAMTAVLGLSPLKVQDICMAIQADSDGCLEVANINDERQVVVSGDTQLISALESRFATSSTTRTVRLSILGAAHCELHRKSRLLNHAVRTTFFGEPSLPVYLSTDSNPVTTSVQALNDVAGILVNKVDWTRTIDQIVTDYPDFNFRLAYPDRAMSRMLTRQIQARRTEIYHNPASHSHKNGGQQ